MLQYSVPCIFVNPANEGEVKNSKYFQNEVKGSLFLTSKQVSAGELNQLILKLICGDGELLQKMKKQLEIQQKLVQDSNREALFAKKYSNTFASKLVFRLNK